MAKTQYFKKSITVFLYVLAFISVAGTLLPLLPFEEWYIRIFDFPRLQLLCMALIALLLPLIFIKKRKSLQKIVIALLLLAIGIQAYEIFPYTPLSPKQVYKLPPSQEQETLQISLLVSNVYMKNDQYERTLAVIDKWQPDVFLALETDKKWQKALSGLKEKYPYTKEVPLDNTYGMLLYSRLPLSHTEVLYLVQDDIPSIFTWVTLPSGNHIQLYCVHPRPPVPGENNDSEERDAEIVLVAKEAKEAAMPVIVAGDFNDVAWSPTTLLFQEVSSLLDPRIGRGFYNTFNAEFPLLRWPLDHFFHSSNFKLIEINRLSGTGSDHFPVYLKVQYEPGAEMEQQGKKADKDTAKEAVETIEEGQDN